MMLVCGFLGCLGHAFNREPSPSPGGASEASGNPQQLADRHSQHGRYTERHLIRAGRTPRPSGMLSSGQQPGATANTVRRPSLEHDMTSTPAAMIAFGQSTPITQPVSQQFENELRSGPVVGAATQPATLVKLERSGASHRTPLHHAAERGQLHVLSAIIESLCCAATAALLDDTGGTGGGGGNGGGALADSSSEGADEQFGGGGGGGAGRSRMTGSGGGAHGVEEGSGGGGAWGRARRRTGEDEQGPGNVRRGSQQAYERSGGGEGGSGFGGTSMMVAGGGGEELPVGRPGVGGAPMAPEQFIQFNLNMQDADGTTALSLACRFGHVDCCRLLLANGSARMLSDARGNTPLHYAALRGHLGVLFMLLDEFLEPDQMQEFSGYVDARNHAGCTPLHYAVWGRQSGSVQVLLQHGADILPRNSRPAQELTPPVMVVGSTPLHLASARGHVEICRIILKTFAERVLEPLQLTEDDPQPPILATLDPRVQVNANGHMPYQVAQRMGFYPLAMLLRPSIPILRLFSDEERVVRFYGPAALHAIAAEALNKKLLSELDALAAAAASATAAVGSGNEGAAGAVGSNSGSDQQQEQRQRQASEASSTLGSVRGGLALPTSARRLQSSQIVSALQVATIGGGAIADGGVGVGIGGADASGNGSGAGTSGSGSPLTQRPVSAPTTLEPLAAAAAPAESGTRSGGGMQEEGAPQPRTPMANDSRAIGAIGSGSDSMSMAGNAMAAGHREPTLDRSLDGRYPQPPHHLMLVVDVGDANVPMSASTIPTPPAGTTAPARAASRRLMLPQALHLDAVLERHDGDEQGQEGGSSTSATPPSAQTNLNGGHSSSGGGGDDGSGGTSNAHQHTAVSRTPPWLDLSSSPLVTYSSPRHNSSRSSLPTTPGSAPPISPGAVFAHLVLPTSPTATLPLPTSSPPTPSPITPPATTTTQLSARIASARRTPPPAPSSHRSRNALMSAAPMVAGLSRPPSAPRTMGQPADDGPTGSVLLSLPGQPDGPELQQLMHGGRGTGTATVVAVPAVAAAAASGEVMAGTATIESGLGLTDGTDSGGGGGSGNGGAEAGPSGVYGPRTPIRQPLGNLSIPRRMPPSPSLAAAASSSAAASNAAGGGGNAPASAPTSASVINGALVLHSGGSRLNISLHAIVPSSPVVAAAPPVTTLPDGVLASRGTDGGRLAELVQLRSNPLFEDVRPGEEGATGGLTAGAGAGSTGAAAAGSLSNAPTGMGMGILQEDSAEGGTSALASRTSSCAAVVPFRPPAAGESDGEDSGGGGEGGAAASSMTRSLQKDAVDGGAAANTAVKVYGNIDDDDEDLECGVCMEPLPPVAISPCRHQICGPCARRICCLNIQKPSYCPFCRATIRAFVAAEPVASHGA